MTASPATILFRNRLFTVGEFRCRPDDFRWSSENLVGDLPHVVHPGTSVVIEQDGRPPVLANRNHVLFYDREQRYRRSLHDERGDRSVFVAVEPRLFAGLLVAAGIRADGALPFGHGPCDPRAYLLQHAAVRELRRPRPDTAMVEEAVLETLARCLARAAAVHGVARPPKRQRTDDEHRGIVERAKVLLTERATARTTVGELASDLHVSESHLARVFRRLTGFTVHGYRTHLRLRLALDLLAVPGSDLTDTAFRLGFSSHGHFTSAFSAVFGCPPSALQAARPPELGRILEAPLARAS